ncbi:MAG: YihY/virulence factor BrkB family protein [Candidatus Paceibacteria bacterium]
MNFLSLFFSAGKLWFKKESDQYAAALAYFVPFALTPLLLISMTLVGLLVGTGRLTDLLASWGDSIDPGLPIIMADALTQLENRSDEFTIPIFAVAFFSIMILVALNSLTAGIHKLWGIERFGLRFLIIRFFRAVLTILLIQLYLVAIIVIGGLVTWIGIIIPTTVEVVIQLFGFLLCTIIFLTFAYRLLPAATLPFRSCFYGGVVAGIMFLGVRAFVTAHLVTAPAVTLYGAASIVIILLMWFYAVGSIILFGAAFAKVHYDTAKNVETSE